MSVITRCPECGTELPTGATQGLCPKCLMGAGLEGDTGRAASGDAEATSTQPSGFVPPEPAELAPLFPHLEILELLGNGGMGAVYKARQTKLDRLVALKIIRPESADDAAFAERFNREAKTLARLNHPNIVGVHDFGEVAVGRTSKSVLGDDPRSARVSDPAEHSDRRSPETAETEPSESFGREGGSVGDRPQHSDRPQHLYFFLMEYVDGTNLRQLIKSNELAPEQALAIVPQICDALQYAHEEGIVHRDIKPENILIDVKGQTKIADFGLAKLATHSPEDFTLTDTHQVMGTPRYMAPEQMEGSHAVDHRADIYALGVVFYEMLTGQVPAGHFEPPSKKVQIDVRLDEVVLRSLAREPDLRYQSASEVKTDVESISESSGVAGRTKARNNAISSAVPSPLKAPSRRAVILALLLWTLIMGSIAAMSLRGYLRWQQMDSTGPIPGQHLTWDAGWWWLAIWLIGVGLVGAYRWLAGMFVKRNRPGLLASLRVAAVVVCIAVCLFGFELARHPLAGGVAIDTGRESDDLRIYIGDELVGTDHAVVSWKRILGWDRQPALGFVLSEDSEPPYLAADRDSNWDAFRGEVSAELLGGSGASVTRFRYGNYLQAGTRRGTFQQKIVELKRADGSLDHVCVFDVELFDLFYRRYRVLVPIRVRWKGDPDQLDSTTRTGHGTTGRRSNFFHRVTPEWKSDREIAVLADRDWWQPGDTGNSKHPIAATPGDAPAAQLGDSGTSRSTLLDSLMEAAIQGNADRVKSALAEGIDPNAKGPDGETALMKAAAAGQARTAVVLLLRGANEQERDKLGQTPLMHAAANGHGDVVSLLCDLNKVHYDDETQFRLTRLDSDLPSDVDFSKMRFDCESTLQDDKGETALMKAAAGGHIECARPLMGTFFSENIALKDKSGRTALMHAVEASQSEFLTAVAVSPGSGGVWLLRYPWATLSRPTFFYPSRSFGPITHPHIENSTVIEYLERNDMRDASKELRSLLQKMTEICSKTINNSRDPKHVIEALQVRANLWRELGEDEKADADIAEAKHLAAEREQ